MRNFGVRVHFVFIFESIGMFFGSSQLASCLLRFLRLPQSRPPLPLPSRRDRRDRGRRPRRGPLEALPPRPTLDPAS